MNDVEFAEQVRQKAIKIAAVCLNNNADNAGIMATELAGFAARFASDTQLQEETETNTYNLAELPRPTPGNAPE